MAARSIAALLLLISAAAHAQVLAPAGTPAGAPAGAPSLLHPAHAPAYALAPAPARAPGPDETRSIAGQNITLGGKMVQWLQPPYAVNSSLPPFKSYSSVNLALYGIAVPAGRPDPDIVVTVTPLTATNNLGVYCLPGWGSFTPQNGSNPSSTYARYIYTTLENGQLRVNISHQDYYFRPLSARNRTTGAYERFQPAFVCSVLNNDVTAPAAYSLEVTFEAAATVPLVAAEQRALAGIWSKCCSGHNASLGFCSNWQPLNGSVYTDFCSTLAYGESCTQEGRLTRLDLAGVNLQCRFPAADFAALTSLTYLDLTYNPNITGPVTDVFAALANATNLRTLKLGNGLMGPLVPHGAGNDSALCKIVHNGLNTIYTTSIPNQGPLPACLFDAGSHMTVLAMGYGNLTGSLPDIPAGSKLRKVSLYNNQLTGTVPSTLSNAVNLTRLDLTYNALVGSIPPSLGSIPDLIYLDLSDNQLKGPLPASLATHAQLQLLSLEHNMLSGPLPAAWVDGWPSAVNSSLQTVYFHSNAFSGGFPAGLAQVPYLQELWMGSNSLSGPLPGGNITVNNNITSRFFALLHVLNITHNGFSGPLPEAWGQMGMFRLPRTAYTWGTFDVSYNHLVGPLPQFLSYSAVPSWARSGIRVAGNSFAYACTLAFSYIFDICPPYPATSSIYNPRPPVGFVPWRALSNGHIIGIVVGVVCAVVVGISACLFKRAHTRRQQRALAKEMPALEMQAHAAGNAPQALNGGTAYAQHAKGQP